MAGLSLSSSTVDKKVESKGRLDNTFVVAAIIFFLVLAGYGGLRWYIGTLDDKLASLDRQLQESSARLRGAKVDRVAAFDARQGIIEQQLGGSPIDSKSLLGQLENLTVPQVRLTKYEFNDSEKFVAVAGETASFRYVAEQIISLKSDDLFKGIKVDSLQRNKDGLVEFSLIAPL